MCYETALTKIKKQVQEYFHKDFVEPDEYEPYYHRSGFTHPILQIIKMDEPNAIYPANWGYIPTWGFKDIPAFQKKYNTLNIRSETLFKGLSKEGANDKRCLIIADGFFEPHKTAGVSIPNFCYIPSKTFEDGRHLFAFGGIYTELEQDTNQLTCSIRTMEANPFFAEVHNIKKRQPFIIDEGLCASRSLSVFFSSTEPKKMYRRAIPNLNEGNVLELITNGFTSKEFKAHPVSTDLYKRNLNTNKPYIIEEIAPPGLLF